MTDTYVIRRARQRVLETLVVYGTLAILAMLYRMCNDDSNEEHNEGSSELHFVFRRCLTTFKVWVLKVGTVLTARPTD